MSGTSNSTAGHPVLRVAAKPTASTCGGAVSRKSLRGLGVKAQAAVSRDAQRLAAAILEVLAGVRTPTEAAAAVSLSVPRYYLWEQRALEGLVRACEPRPKGQVVSQRHQIAVLEKEVLRLRQDCARQQALVRASQRTIGLAPSPQAATKASAKPGGKAAGKTASGAVGKAKRKRRPVARALKAAAALQAAPSEGESPADSSSAIAADVVQRSVSSSSLATAETAPVDQFVAPAVVAEA
jgi:hypothetical protein